MATGKLMWGQAGEYDGIDDRRVITALVNGAPGVLQAPTLTAGTGLQVRVGPFVAAVSCDDGTVAVAASGDETLIDIDAGPTSGNRVDVMWLSADPDNAVWSLDPVANTDLAGRLGISLGAVNVPQGANLATQFTYLPTINNLPYLRAFQTNAARRLFVANLDTAWRAGGGGQLTAITNDDRPGPLNDTNHLDVASPRFGGGQWELIWTDVDRGFTQSGFAAYLTNGAGVLTITWPIPFTASGNQPHVVAMVTDWQSARLTVLGNANGPTATQMVARNPVTNALLANAYVQVFWIARGLIVTDTFQ